MLKLVYAEQLQLGMYVHEFCGSWFNHPFWRENFLLDDTETLEKILSTGIQEVWIDTDKGLDCEGGKTEEMLASKISGLLARADTRKKIPRHVGTAKEAERAARICAESKKAVASMFHEVRMGKAINASDVLPIVEEITTSVLRNSGALISLARLKDKDSYTYMHSVSACGLMAALARTLELNAEQIRNAAMAGLVHDIGKTKTPLGILNKSGKLSEDEFEVIKKHPADGHKLLQEGKGISDIALIVCLQHHEKLDGSGYPNNLTHEQIGPYAKMSAVCDVYDAITSDRPYKKGWEPAEAIRKMAEWSYRYFDKRIFHAFVKTIGIYPVGTLVKLDSDRLGVVIEQTNYSLLTPILMVFFSVESNSRIALEILDLSKPGCKDKIVSHEDPKKWNISDIHELWSGLSAAPMMSDIST